LKIKDKNWRVVVIIVLMNLVTTVIQKILILLWNHVAL